MPRATPPTLECNADAQIVPIEDLKQGFMVGSVKREALGVILRPEPLGADFGIVQASEQNCDGFCLES